MGIFEHDSDAVDECDAHRGRHTHPGGASPIRETVNSIPPRFPWTLIRNCGVTAAPLWEWGEALLAAGEDGLNIRQEGPVDEQGRRMKSGIAEQTMEKDLLRERIRRMEDEEPFLPWRPSKRTVPGRLLRDIAPGISRVLRARDPPRSTARGGLAKRCLRSRLPHDENSKTLSRNQGRHSEVSQGVARTGQFLSARGAREAADAPPAGRSWTPPPRKRYVGLDTQGRT